MLLSKTRGSQRSAPERSDAASLRQSVQPAPRPAAQNTKSDQVIDQECTVLVINSSQDMAKEITLQLTLKIPGCSIMYAPTIEMAKWILKRRKIDLVVSSALLPDGSIAALKTVLQTMQQPPNVVVVGDMKVKSAEMLEKTGYEFQAVKRLGQQDPAATNKPTRQLPLLKRTIQDLGADIRNDLNNPLQEIVAMVFVAQAGAGTPMATEKALDAIDTAAKNMARVVSELENKILDAVKPHTR